MVGVTNKFRIQTKKLFGTYSQCNLDKQVVLDWFQKQFEVSRYIVAHEKHQDGGDHLHVYFEFRKTCNIVNCHRCDIEGHHPSIEAVKSPSKCQSYCKKDGDYLTNMMFNVEAQAVELAKAGKVGDAIDLIINEMPSEVKFLDRWIKNLKTIWKRERLKLKRSKPKNLVQKSSSFQKESKKMGTK